MGAPPFAIFEGWDSSNVNYSAVPLDLKRYHGLSDLHFITFSCFQRFPYLAVPFGRDVFLEIFEEVRRRYCFSVTGYVVMPEHVHLLISEPERKSLSVVMQVLKQSVARKLLRENTELEHCPGARESAPLHFWQKRYYDFNVWSADKEREKLRYIHRNPVKRGLVMSPEEWKWSSFRAYAYREPGIVKVNEPFLTHPSKTAKGGAPTAN
jgi:putative transposase